MYIESVEVMQLSRAPPVCAEMRPSPDRSPWSDGAVTGPTIRLGWTAGGPIAAPVYAHPMSPMPEPGDRSPGFMAEAGRCWALVYLATAPEHTLPRHAVVGGSLVLTER